MEHRPPHGLDRRRFLLAGASLVAVGGLAAACGDDEEEPATSAAAEPTQAATSAPPPTSSAAASTEAPATSAADATTAEAASTAAASGAGAEETARRPPAAEESGSLAVYDYQGYELPDLWTEYAEKWPGQDPKFTFLPSDAEALAKVTAGFKADTLHPCSAFVQEFVSTGLFTPFDTSLLSHFPDLNPNLVEVGKVDGEQYMVPADWGFISLLTNTEHVDPGQEPSWNLMFDKQYEGKIAWYDNPFDMMIIGGYAVGAADPWNMTDEELEAVKAKYVEAKPYVRTFWSSQADMETEFKAGNIWLSFAWPSSWVLMQKEGLKVDYLNPKEGRLAFLCGFSLFKDTEAWHHAHDYVNAWTSPEAGLWLVNNYAYGHSNTKIDLSQVDPALVEAFGLEDPDAIAEPAVHVLRPSPVRVKMARVWEEIKAA